MNCDRCHTETISHTMSWFNTERICDECDEKELAHPDIKKAKDAERSACLSGDMNFKGIGKPSDL